MNNQSPELSGICSKIYRHSPDGDDACIETEDALPLQERGNTENRVISSHCGCCSDLYNFGISE